MSATVTHRPPSRLPLRPDEVRARLGRRPVLVTAAVLISAQVGFRGWMLSHSWFANDDFTWIQDALRTRLTLDYLLHPHAGHLMPAGFLLTWVNARLGALDFVFPAAELLVFQLLAGIGCFRLLRHLCGERWGIIPPLLVFLASPITLPAASWWAAGANQWPVILAIFYGLHPLVTHLRTGQRKYAVRSLIWTVSMLLFCEKVLLAYVVFGILAVSYFAAGHFLERCLTVATRYRFAVVSHLVVLLAYVPYYLVHAINFDATTMGSQPLDALTSNMAAAAFSTGILGGPLQWNSFNVFFALAKPPDLVKVLSWVVIAAVVRAGAVSRRRSLRAWAPLVAILALDILLLATGRAYMAGPLLGMEYRYQTEVPAVASICLALAFLPLLGSVESAGKVRDHGFADSRLYLGLLLGVVGAASLASSVGFMAPGLVRRSPEVYYRNFARSLAQQPHPVPMANLAVPDRIWMRLAFPHNLYSGMFAMYRDDLRFPDINSDSMYVVDDGGRIRPMTIEPARHNRPARAHECGYLTAGQGTRIPLDGPVLGFGWWLRISYLSTADSPMTVSVGEHAYRGRLRKGFHTLFVRGDGQYSSIRVSGLARGRACINEVVLGTPKPFVAR